MSLGVFLRVCKRVWAGCPPSRLQGIAPLTSRSVTENAEVIDQSHQGDGGAGFQLLHSWGNTGSFLRLSCYSEALHLLEQCGASSCFLLCEPVVLTVTMPRKHSVPLPQPVRTLTAKSRGSGKKEGGL